MMVFKMIYNEYNKLSQITKIIPETILERGTLYYIIFFQTNRLIKRKILLWDFSLLSLNFDILHYNFYAIWDTLKYTITITKSRYNQE